MIVQTIEREDWNLGLVLSPVGSYMKSYPTENSLR